MLIIEQLFRSAIVIYLLRYTQCRPAMMRFDPTPSIWPNFHGPFVTVLTGFYCILKEGCAEEAGSLQALQPNQVKRSPQDYINKLII